MRYSVNENGSSPPRSMLTFSVVTGAHTVACACFLQARRLLGSSVGAHPWAGVSDAPFAASIFVCFSASISHFGISLGRVFVFLLFVLSQLFHPHPPLRQAVATLSSRPEGHAYVSGCPLPCPCAAPRCHPRDRAVPSHFAHPRARSRPNGRCICESVSVLLVHLFSGFSC